MSRIPDSCMLNLYKSAYMILKDAMPAEPLFLDGYPFYIVRVRDNKKTEYWCTTDLHPLRDRQYESSGFELASLDVRVLYYVEPKHKTAKPFLLFS